MRKCRQEHRECQIHRKTEKPFCGCPIGQKYKEIPGGKSFCEKVDSCATCEHKCHKASKCLPASAGSRLGYDCAVCNEKLGYRGDGYSCENIDECAADNTNDCDKPNAICEDRDPVYDDDLKYICTCTDGWKGDPKGGYKWRPCKDTNECLNETVCGPNTICVNTPGSYICQCKPGGFIKKPGNPKECIDKNECLEGNPCHPQANCINTIGSFQCKCKEGFKGDGMKQCVPDKDYWCGKCDNQTTKCEISEKGDSYLCNCKKGFRQVAGISGKCEDIPECNDPKLNDCDKTPGRATCHELPGSFNCSCNKNYKGDGKNCIPEDPCEISYPCATIPGTKCVNNNGKAVCECKVGFVRQIADTNNKSAPCYDVNTAPVNNCTICDNATAVCQKLKPDAPFFECVCRPGYQRNAAGKCVNINECQKASDNNCDDNANCFDKEPAIDGKRFECRCKPGFEGEGTLNKCKDHDECKNKTLNACPDPNTHCVNTVGSYSCACNDGLRKMKGSELCVNINECEEGLAHCPLMAKCVDKTPGFDCECLPGFKNGTKDGKFDCINIDECKEGINGNGESPCDNENGVCKDTFGSFLCSCKNGFVIGYDRKQCVDLDECKRGTSTCNPQVEECENTIGSFKCNCKYGMVPNKLTGKCEDLDECKAKVHKCKKHSVCINTFASYKCECEKGFKPKTGTHPLRPACERDNICIKNPTICNPGNCESIESPPYYKCNCPPSTVPLNGTKCLPTTYCDKNFPCPIDSVCAKGHCNCNTGYSWQDVTDFPLTEKSLRNRPGCKEINPCLETNLCLEPLKCRHTGPGKHVCECRAGYERVDKECIDIDECELQDGAPECPKQSKCKNLIGSYKCECEKGYTAAIGSSLTKPKCIDVNECEVDGLNDCDKKNGTCVNTVGSFQCKCKKGYREQPPDYTTCKDVDECKEGNNNCDKTNALCVNTPGGYDCQCKPGFFGDGETCQDVNECNPADPKHNCTDSMVCVNLPGSFKCECKPGYTVGEKGCEDINECLSPEKNNCSKTTGDVRLKCVNEPGSYSCVCPSGYAQVAKDKCTDIDECKQSPSVCPNFEPDTCINTNGSFTCGCKSGYAKPKNCEDPKKCACVDIDECLVGTKVNGKFKPACGPNAKCQNTLGAHKCECSEGYSGDAYNEGCKISDACKAKNPCDKDTQDCVSAGDKAVCACKKGYLPTNNDKCQKNPCLKDRGGCGKGAVCVPVKVEENIQPVCKCKPGQQLDDQKNCEAVDQCQCKTPVPIGTPCHSKVRCNADHMLCVNLGTSANCTCQRGFKLSKDGKSCDNIDECKEGVEANLKNVACDPQAKCIDAIGSFECDCPRGQRENHEHKCVPDVDCTKERGCKHDKNAFCSNVNSTYIFCQCKHGFTGSGLQGDGLCQPENFCKVAEKELKGKPVCPPNEHCFNGPKKYECKCNVGFERDPKTNTCEDIDECKLGSAECRPTYICNNTIGSYVCSCPKGYRQNATDLRCDDINECTEKKDDCDGKKERCINLPGSFKCECASPAYIRSNIGCVDNDECNTNQFECPQFSNCQNKDGGYDCICSKGFKPVVKNGKTVKCEDIDECQDPKSCPKESTCKNLVGTYQCDCHAPAIQHGLQDCVKNASCPECHKLASCLKSVKEDGEVFNCTCNSGYSGDGVKSCEPVDECALGTYKCHKLAKCIDETPGYSCICNEPLEGDGKNQCNMPDLCKKYNDCPQGSQCVPLNGSSIDGKFVTCNCTKGLRFNTKTRQCDDIDECKEKDDACPKTPKGVQCFNTQGSYYCKCPSGYRIAGKDKQKCEDIDECLEQGGVICSKQGAKCQNTLGDFICKCPKGMKVASDNKTCSDVDECAEKLDDCDQKTTTCKNTIGSFKCECKPGLAKIPTKTNICEDVNECELNTHNCKAASQLCHNTFGSFVCNCSNNYELKGKECVPLNECDKSIECGANALCVMRASREDPSKKTPQCVCQDGFYGENPKEFCDPVADCEKDLQCPTNSKCVESQVKNKAGRALFKCACDAGYRKVGSQCAPINECAENPNLCNGTAVCVDLTPGYRCECPSNQIDVGIGKNNVTCVVPKCSDVKKPCHPDADCLDSKHGFECRCKKGFRGVGTTQLGCEPVPYCEDYIPCSQYARCVNKPRGSFTCSCRTGYEGNGTICHDINECKNPKACDKDATCQNTQGSYKCNCNPGFAGTGLPGQCKDIDECADPRLNKCDVGSTNCVNKIGSFECHCKPGYAKSSKSNTTCDDINECLDKKNPVCKIHRCNNLPGTYRCDCNPGYKLASDGKNCEDINECSARPCHVKAECTNTEGSYSCVCREGYEGDGKKSCEPINKCAKPELNSCNQNTTSCVQIENSARYRCQCREGYIPPLNVTGRYYTCIDENECLTGKAKYDPLTEICENLEPGYKVTCKEGFERDPKTKKCVDHNECADDPSFGETLKIFEEAKKSGKNLDSWQKWMIKPKNSSSAYGICYNKAVSSEYWWFTSSSSPLPFCRNTAFNPKGALNGKVKEWKGFECDCAPTDKRKETISAVRVVMKCEISDPCEALKCPSLGEGFICDKEKQVCKCDGSKGYIERVGDKGSFCSKDECTELDTQGPLTVSNIQHRSMIVCDVEHKKWRKVKGYDFVRDNKTNAVIGLKDIDECLDENYCCNRKTAQCTTHGGPNKCEMKCKNFDGGATCYCDSNKLDVIINRDTCQCMPKCAVNSAWYLNCDGSNVECNLDVFQKLLEDKNAPKSTVCSRLVDESGKYMTFPNIIEIVKEICKKKFYCAFPTEKIDDIRKLPGFNYEGKCIDHNEQIDSVKCPFGDKPEPLKGAVSGAFCPFQIDQKAWPPLNPEYQKRDGFSMPLTCLPNGLKLARDVLFLSDGNRYSMEAF